MSKITPEQLTDWQPPFPKSLGVKFTHAELDLVKSEMLVREDLTTLPATIHGGALMSLADVTGAMGSVINLKEGERTTTLESKTNFIRPVPVGEVAYATCTPVHKGRQTQVWRTEITREDGKLAGVVTQTQFTLPAIEGDGGGKPS